MFAARVLGAREPPVLGASGFVFINMMLRQNTVKRLDGQDGFEHLGNKPTYGVGHANKANKRNGSYIEVLHLWYSGTVVLRE